MFQNLYKKSLNIYEKQEIRREQLLQQQKLKRLNVQDDHRNNQADLHYKRKKKYYIKSKNYKNSAVDDVYLQFSEWLKEKPDNLDDWLLIPCPKGQRCLVVAENGKTKMFSKNKKYRMTFLSLLPGGGLTGSDNDYCVLDCIFNQEKELFYILDALHFAIPLVCCDTEFRFFWLKSKFNEFDLGQNSKSDNVKNFKLLDNYDISDKERLTAVLQKFPLWPNNKPELDGFLFYHKKTHYVFGSTPLVCWLFPFMLPDVLQIPVCGAYVSPENYSSQNPWQYMDEFDNIRRNTANQNKSYLNRISMEDDAEPDSPGTMDEDNSLESLLVAEKMLELEEAY